MQGPFTRADEPGAGLGPARTSGTASAALVSGIVSFLCAYGIGGFLAIALGWIAHSEIDKSDGRLRGKALATTGIGLGIVNVVASVVALGVLVAYAVRPDPPSAAVTPPALPPAVTVPAPTPAPGPGLRGPRAPSQQAQLPTLPPKIGKVAIVEVADAALAPLLLDQVKEGAKSGEKVMLWTVAAGCAPCDAVGRALPDARMQRALTGIRLVRADVATSNLELDELGVPVDSIPGFTLLDNRARPVDHIHGGEWGDDIPANIAPILDKFVHRSLSTRRFPWSRPLRDGETPL